MDRRDMIRSLSATLALPFVGTAENALAIGEAVHESIAGNTVDRALNPAQQELVAVLADRILPATATPGALDVEVPAFIDRLLTEWYEPADADVFRSDLAAIDARARAAHGAGFASLTEDLQLELMRELDGAGAPDRQAARGFQQVKSLTVFGYFTSERVSKEVLRTEVIFADYDGCAPVSG
jgi:hypothetical protein